MINFDDFIIVLSFLNLAILAIFSDFFDFSDYILVLNLLVLRFSRFPQLLDNDFSNFDDSFRISQVYYFFGVLSIFNTVRIAQLEYKSVSPLKRQLVGSQSNHAKTAATPPAAAIA